MRDDPVRIIREAIENQSDLESAVDRTLAIYQGRSLAVSGSELSTLKPRSSIDHLLEALMSQCLKDERYLEVFDLLHVRQPNNINVLESKALAYTFVDEQATIDALSQAIALLEEKEGEADELPSFYLWLGRTIEQTRQWPRAFCAYNLALSYCSPEGPNKIVHYHILYRRAYLYLKNRQEQQAREDLFEINKIHNKSIYLADLHKDMKKQEEHF